MLKKISIAGRVTIAIGAFLVLLSAGLIVSAYLLVSDKMAEQAQAAQQTNMRVAWDVLKQNGTEFAVKDGKLYAGETLLNDNNEIVDKIKELVGGTATIFQGDTRVATNVMKPDGSGRAVGTQLAKNAANDSVLGQGKPYNGTVDILGQTFFTGYDPIKNAAGETIGILYVGVKKSDYFALVDSLLMSFGLVTLGLMTVLMILGFVVTRRLLEAAHPAASIAHRTRCRQSPRPPSCIPSASDEIGVMARTVALFKDGMGERNRLQAAQETERAAAQADRAKALHGVAEEFRQSVLGVVDRVADATNNLRGGADSVAPPGRQHHGRCRLGQ